MGSRVGATFRITTEFYDLEVSEISVDRVIRILGRVRGHETVTGSADYHSAGLHRTVGWWRWEYHRASVLSRIAASRQAVGGGEVLAAERRRAAKVTGERAETERGQRTSEALCGGQDEGQDEGEADCESFHFGWLFFFDCVTQKHKNHTSRSQLAGFNWQHCTRARNSWQQGWTGSGVDTTFFTHTRIHGHTPTSDSRMHENPDTFRFSVLGDSSRGDI